jgi:hypothetical protein
MTLTRSKTGQFVYMENILANLVLGLFWMLKDKMHLENTIP